MLCIDEDLLIPEALRDLSSRITAQLIDARSDRHLWAQGFESETSDILFLQDSVAREIASQTLNLSE